MNLTLSENYVREALSWIDIIESNSLAKQQAKQLLHKTLDLLKEAETKNVLKENNANESMESSDANSGN